MSDEDAALIAQYGDDPELLAALKASMNEAQLASYVIPDEPPADAEPSLVTLIRLRGPNGENYSRRFLRA